MKLPISLVIITKNEEKHIARALSSVDFCQEKLVIDSSSTDRTVELARELGARVIEHPWQGFGLQRRFATEMAVNDWVLFLDADEMVSPELAEEIQKKFAAWSPSTALRMPRLSFHMGRWIRHGGWYPDRQTRLFHRQFAQWNEAPLHERVEATTFEDLEHPLFHYVFRDLSHQVVTNDRYSTLGAENLASQGGRFQLWQLIFRPFGKFMECYFVKLGFLDGLPGFVIAIGAAYSLFLRYAKLWEKSAMSFQIAKDKK